MTVNMPTNAHVECDNCGEEGEVEVMELAGGELASVGVDDSSIEDIGWFVGYCGTEIYCSESCRDSAES